MPGHRERTRRSWLEARISFRLEPSGFEPNSIGQLKPRSIKKSRFEVYSSILAWCWPLGERELPIYCPGSCSAPELLRVRQHLSLIQFNRAMGNIIPATIMNGDKTHSNITAKGSSNTITFPSLRSNGLHPPLSPRLGHGHLTFEVLLHPADRRPASKILLPL
jgi:hypothetical protein